MVNIVGFPHSDIFGSKVARHLPEAYRSHATSFIGSLCQGIRHRPLTYIYSPNFLDINPAMRDKSRVIFC